MVFPWCWSEFPLRSRDKKKNLEGFEAHDVSRSSSQLGDTYMYRGGRGGEIDGENGGKIMGKNPWSMVNHGEITYKLGKPWKIKYPSIVKKYGSFHTCKYPKWMVFKAKPIYKWMMTGGTPTLGNLDMVDHGKIKYQLGKSWGRIRNHGENLKNKLLLGMWIGWNLWQVTWKNMAILSKRWHSKLVRHFSGVHIPLLNIKIAWKGMFIPFMVSRGDDVLQPYGLFNTSQVNRCLGTTRSSVPTPPTRPLICWMSEMVPRTLFESRFLKLGCLPNPIRFIKVPSSAMGGNDRRLALRTA